MCVYERVCECVCVCLDVMNVRIRVRTTTGRGGLPNFTRNAIASLAGFGGLLSVYT